jgi:hypothetical protein
MPRAVRLTAVLALLAGVLLTAGCGHSETGYQVAATSEGLYQEQGGLKYQVQISRYLNPADPEDSAYLKGLPSGMRLANNQIWFGVFMRVENDGQRTASATSAYVITDTLGHKFRPVALNPNVNPFAYRPRPLAPGTLLPTPDSVAGQGAIKGSLVLFRLNEADLQNRPLDLHIGQTRPATVELDL